MENQRFPFCLSYAKNELSIVTMYGCIRLEDIIGLEFGTSISVFHSIQSIMHLCATNRIKTIESKRIICCHKLTDFLFSSFLF